MYGDPREAAELAILAQLNALTTADGLPETFRLVTRDFLHLADIKPAQLPCALVQFEEPEMNAMLSHIYECTVPGRVVVAFPPDTVLPASTANAYRLTIERMLMQDVHLGGLVDLVSLKGTLQPGLWPEVGLLATGVLFQLLFEYDARAAARTA
jgi:hypothetical protein